MLLVVLYLIKKKIKLSNKSKGMFFKYYLIALFTLFLSFKNIHFYFKPTQTPLRFDRITLAIGVLGLIMVLCNCLKGMYANQYSLDL